MTTLLEEVYCLKEFSKMQADTQKNSLKLMTLYVGESEYHGWHRSEVLEGEGYKVIIYRPGRPPVNENEQDGNL